MKNGRKTLKFIGALFAVALMVALATGASYPATVISANAAANPEIEIEETEIEIKETEAVASDSIINAAMSVTRDHLLSGYSYDYTPQSEFSRKPVYGAYDLSEVRVGDIIYEEVDNSPEGGHAAIVSDISHNSYYGKYIQTIEVTPEKGVTYGFLDDRRIYEFSSSSSFVYLSDMQQRIDAVDFCKSQLGKGYRYDTDNSPIDSDVNQPDWYSSELVYAGYQAGMGRGLMTGSTEGHILPQHLYWTWETETTVTYMDMFLDIKLDTSGAKWTFIVTNNMGSSVLLKYNTKLCYESDAKNWTNLKDVNSNYTLLKGESLSVRVTTNVFATTAAFSWTFSNEYVDKRMITYANKLSSDGTMNIMHNMVDNK